METPNDLRLAGQFCDAVLQVEDVQFPIHRIILSDFSTYFQTLFVHQITTDKVFHITLVSPDIMQIIIEFAYTGSITVTKDNVHELMVAADMLNIIGIIQACSSFISEHLCLQNCIGIWQFTDICPSSELRCKAFQYIMEHFERAINFKEHLQLSVLDLRKILCKDELNVKNERTVFDVILRWIAHIPNEREQHIAVLLSQVRLGKTSIAYIENNVMTNQLVKFNPECQKIVSHSFRIMLSLYKHIHKPLRSCLSDTPARPRLPHSVIWVSGGRKERYASRDIEVYDHLVDRWIYIRDKLKDPRADHGTAFLDGYVYFVGGYNLMESLNSMVRLDLKRHTWQEKMHMYHRRRNLSLTVLNGFIYALGGFNGYASLDTAERYCPKTNKWTVIAPMIESRRSASCATLDDKIYICGGLTGRYSTRSAECYDPETNQWTLIHHMSISRSQHRVVAYNNQIYACQPHCGTKRDVRRFSERLHQIPPDNYWNILFLIEKRQESRPSYPKIGGLSNVNPLKSVETYMPETNSWSNLCPMWIQRRNFCLEVIEDQFYVVGGTNFRTKSYHAEVYDPHTNRWFSISDSNMSYNGMSSCVVFGIPNMVDFAFPRNALPRF